MRAIVVMFDSLNRVSLPPYNPATNIQAPNFERLAQRSVTFDTCYAGSMPCMPARRELHTGRHNFLHRGWGPMEPFDDSVPELLRKHGIHTHMATDHMHYWEDGGATYHPRYSTHSLIRGQQGDPWKGEVEVPRTENNLRVGRPGTWRQDQINRKYLTGLSEHPQVRTFDAAEEFLRANSTVQNWMLHVETFDPHEPFFSNPEFTDQYDDPDYDGPDYDWPDYMRDIEDDATRAHVRNRYSALVAMCDRSLGRILDLMDEYGLWDDTLLIVCTDHGFFLGERGWWGKGVQPWYDEVIHTPLFVWDPKSAEAGTRQDVLVQTIDIAPTLLDHFGLQPTEDMQGVSLSRVLDGGAKPHEYALFGAFGGQVSVTDGRYVYMRTCSTPENAPLYEHTLMPTHMRGFFAAEELRDAELVDPLPFTKGMPVLRTPAAPVASPHSFGTLLFDLESDPRQQHPLVDDELELRMCSALVRLMRAAAAPPSQFERLGLPAAQRVGVEHLQCAAQTPVDLFLPGDEFAGGTPSVHTRVDELMADDEVMAILSRHVDTRLLSGLFPQIAGPVSLYRATVALNGRISWDALRAISVELAEYQRASASMTTRRGEMRVG